MSYWKIAMIVVVAIMIVLAWWGAHSSFKSIKWYGHDHKLPPTQRPAPPTPVFKNAAEEHNYEAELKSRWHKYFDELEKAPHKKHVAADFRLHQVPEFRLQKGIPVPPESPLRADQQRLIAFCNGMEVGDSTFVRRNKYHPNIHKILTRECAPFVFDRREAREYENGLSVWGVRIWRIL